MANDIANLHFSFLHFPLKHTHKYSHTYTHTHTHTHTHCPPLLARRQLILLLNHNKKQVSGLRRVRFPLCRCLQREGRRERGGERESGREREGASGSASVAHLREIDGGRFAPPPTD